MLSFSTSDKQKIFTEAEHGKFCALLKTSENHSHTNPAAAKTGAKKSLEQSDFLQHTCEFYEDVYNTEIM